MASDAEIRCLRLAAQLLAGAVVVAYAIVLQSGWPMILCLTVLCGTALMAACRPFGSRAAIGVAWVVTVGAWSGALAGHPALATFDGYVLVAAGMAALLLSIGSAGPGTPAAAWRLLGAAWLAGTVLLWLALAYSLNAPVPFYMGLVASLALLIWIKVQFPLPPALVLTTNTMLLLLIGIPVADLLTRPSYRMEVRPDARQRLYSYVEARKNPTAFERWWDYFVREWEVTKQSICMPATNSIAPFRLRPGSEGMMFESRIQINQLGFRGPEIPWDKGDAYRIVALGESTTFGHTMYAEDRPWPRVLEDLITQRLNPGRPIQVINAGIPSYTLWLNLERLQRQILALEPDLIISYHGYNGFNWLMPDLPAVTGRRPPKYVTRPVKLFADAEYRFKVMAYRREVARTPARVRTPARSITDNEYARGYRELAAIARTNNIRLAVANYSMAVNANSELDVIAFYRGGFPNVLNQIKANQIHSQIVSNLARQYPEVTCVNTHPALDGQYDKFIDLVHFTQEGREIMAATMFEAIRPMLEKDLGKTQL